MKISMCYKKVCVFLLYMVSLWVFLKMVYGFNVDSELFSQHEGLIVKKTREKSKPWESNFVLHFICLILEIFYTNF